MFKRIDKKIITLIVCLVLLTTGIIQCSAISINKKIEKYDQNKILKNNNLDENQDITFNYIFITSELSKKRSVFFYPDTGCAS